MLDSLAPEVVGPYLRGKFGDPYLYEPECESTQLLLLDADVPEGAVAATDHQTAGRGRLGRRWEEPPATSVLCSVKLEPLADRHLAELSLVAAVAVAEAVETATDLSAQIKWPNDVMLNRRKVAGILAELRGEWMVVGIGINVNQTREQLPVVTTTPVASLRVLTGHAHARAELLGSLLWRLEHLYASWRDGGLADVYDGLGSRDFLRGRRISVDGRSGVASRIDRSGRLEVDIGGELELVESGEISYER